MSNINLSTFFSNTYSLTSQDAMMGIQLSGEPQKASGQIGNKALTERHIVQIKPEEAPQNAQKNREMRQALLESAKAYMGKNKVEEQQMNDVLDKISRELGIDGDKKDLGDKMLTKLESRRIANYVRAQTGEARRLVVDACKAAPLPESATKALEKTLNAQANHPDVMAFLDAYGAGRRNIDLLSRVAALAVQSDGTLDSYTRNFLIGFSVRMTPSTSATELTATDMNLERAISALPQNEGKKSVQKIRLDDAIRALTKESNALMDQLEKDFAKNVNFTGESGKKKFADLKKGLDDFISSLSKESKFLNAMQHAYEDSNGPRQILNEKIKEMKEHITKFKQELEKSESQTENQETETETTTQKEAQKEIDDQSKTDNLNNNNANNGSIKNNNSNINLGKNNENTENDNKDIKNQNKNIENKEGAENKTTNYESGAGKKIVNGDAEKRMNNAQKPQTKLIDLTPEQKKIISDSGKNGVDFVLKDYHNRPIKNNVFPLLKAYNINEDTFEVCLGSGNLAEILFKLGEPETKITREILDEIKEPQSPPNQEDLEQLCAQGLAKIDALYKPLVNALENCIKEYTAKNPGSQPNGDDLLAELSKITLPEQSDQSKTNSATNQTNSTTAQNENIIINQQQNQNQASGKFDDMGKKEIENLFDTLDTKLTDSDIVKLDKSTNPILSAHKDLTVENLLDWANETDVTNALFGDQKKNDQYAKMVQQRLVKSLLFKPQLPEMISEGIKSVSQIADVKKVFVGFFMQAVTPGTVFTFDDIQDVPAKLRNYEYVKENIEIFLTNAIPKLTEVEKKYIRSEFQKSMPPDFQKAMGNEVCFLSKGPKELKNQLQASFNQYAQKARFRATGFGERLNKTGAESFNYTTIEIGKHPTQAKNIKKDMFLGQGTNTCFMMSLVNGLLATDKGVRYLKACMKDWPKKLVLPSPKENSTKVSYSFERRSVKSVSFSYLEHALYEAYANEFKVNEMYKGILPSRLGSPGDVEIAAHALGFQLDGMSSYFAGGTVLSRTDGKEVKEPPADTAKNMWNDVVNTLSQKGLCVYYSGELQPDGKSDPTGRGHFVAVTAAYMEGKNHCIEVRDSFTGSIKQINLDEKCLTLSAQQRENYGISLAMFLPRKDNGDYNNAQE